MLFDFCFESSIIFFNFLDVVQEYMNLQNHDQKEIPDLERVSWRA